MLEGLILQQVNLIFSNLRVKAISNKIKRNNEKKIRLVGISEDQSSKSKRILKIYPQI